jgi:tetratricopeptide (TPR) repeat protein
VEAAAVLALVVALVDTLGWREWRLIVDLTSVNSEAAAQRLASGRLVGLPSVVERTRKLATDQLAGATPESLAAALARIGGLQRRWMPTAAFGFLNLASEEFLRGRIRDSVTALGEALARDPTSPSLHRIQALFLFSVGQRQGALAELAIAEAIAPGFHEPEVELTFEDERSVIFEGLRMRTEFYPRRATENALALARAIREKGDDDEARSELARFRGQPAVEIELARWAIDEGDLEAAVEMLLPIALRSANPRSLRAQAWSVISVARDLSGDVEAALAAAGEALALDPNSPAPYLTLAGLAQGRGDLQSAFEHLQRAWGMDPVNTGLLTRIASVAEQAGKTADALLALERAVEIDPGTPRLAVLLVELQLRTGHYAEAAMSLSRALDRHPTDPGLLRLADRLPREVGIR